MKQTTSVTLSRETLSKLNLYKYKLNCKSVEEVIQRLMKMVTKFKLGKELEDINEPDKQSD